IDIVRFQISATQVYLQGSIPEFRSASSEGPCDETDRSQRCEICDCLGIEGRYKREFLRYVCEM
uniref:Uncharacterized protein n=1 Tax=Parascaris equorum TaxID=6256 RepID=A0A914S352_PAREQ